MKKHGDVKYSKGRFSVVELREVHIDGTFELVGFVLTGPGVDGNYMYANFKEAVAKADKHFRDNRPNNSRGMGM